jgi:predicted nucleic acid-binding protein
MRKVLIDGFKQDSLSVEQDYGSTVILSNNIIRSVHAVIGKSEGSSSRIILQQTNQFDNVSLDIGHRSKLELENCMISHLAYHLSDSAKLIVKGNAQALLNNLNHFHQ